jgi:hypothetical protein
MTKKAREEIGRNLKNAVVSYERFLNMLAGEGQEDEFRHLIAFISRVHVDILGALVLIYDEVERTGREKA